MRIDGKKIERNEPETIVIPRTEGDIVLEAKPVLDYEDFLNLCPPPKPPEKVLPGGRRVSDVEDPDYNLELQEWSANKVFWTVLESLRATPNLEWDTIEYGNYETWKNLPEELKEAGFSTIEQNKIFQHVFAVSGLSEKRIEEATQSFLAAREATLDIESSPSTEQQDTQSGEPAND